MTQLESLISSLPLTPGVYQMKDAAGEILYVGKAKNLRKRVTSYTKTDRLPVRLQRMVARIHAVDIIPTKTEVDALLLECNLIKTLRPPYNILLKDDKSFPYLRLTTDHPFPRLEKYRGSRTGKGEYFGPFAQAEAVDETLSWVFKIFQLRSCTDRNFERRERPCLQYYIKRCSAPCVGKVSDIAYQESIEGARAFLKGESDHLQNAITQRMQDASDHLAFERAAQYRDQLRLLRQIQARQHIHIPGLGDTDIFALSSRNGEACVWVSFFRYGRNLGQEGFFISFDEVASEILTTFLMQFYDERIPPAQIVVSHDVSLSLKDALGKRHQTSLTIILPKRGVRRELIDQSVVQANQALDRRQKTSLVALGEDFQRVFGLPRAPERIEVYDNSHCFGDHPYGVKIVATCEGFEKKSYRKFRFEDGNRDDFAMMAEMMRRRFKDLSLLPDLLLIDGGRGQIRAVWGVLQELDLIIPVVGIAKGEDRNAGQETFHAGSGEVFVEEGLRTYLQILRDEAHRFAIGAHRSARKKALSLSTLDSLPGIGPVRKRRLLRHFGSMNAIRHAPLEDLENIVGSATARALYSLFHEA